MKLYLGLVSKINKQPKCGAKMGPLEMGTPMREPKLSVKSCKIYGYVPSPLCVCRSFCQNKVFSLSIPLVPGMQQNTGEPRAGQQAGEKVILCRGRVLLTMYRLTREKQSKSVSHAAHITPLKSHYFRKALWLHSGA